MKFIVNFRTFSVLMQTHESMSSMTFQFSIWLLKLFNIIYIKRIIKAEFAIGKKTNPNHLISNLDVPVHHSVSCESPIILVIGRQVEAYLVFEGLKKRCAYVKAKK